MKFLEQNLEDIIFKTNNNDLHDRGLYIEGIKLRQLNIGGYGIADIVSFQRGKYVGSYKNPYECINIVGPFWEPPIITIYELKKDLITEQTFFQALRYLQGIKRYLEERNSLKYRYYNIEDLQYKDVQFHITLIGKNVDSSDVCYLPDIYNNIDLMRYSYDYNGIQFYDMRGYKLTNEGFKK